MFTFNVCQRQHIQRRIQRWQIRHFVMPETDKRKFCKHTG